MRARKFMKRALSQDEGTSSAEFALVVPVMAILFIGLIDVGSLAWTALQGKPPRGPEQPLPCFMVTMMNSSPTP